MTMKKGPLFKKPCIRCEKYFIPSSKFSRLCDKCLEDLKNEKLKRNKIKRKLKIKSP